MREWIKKNDYNIFYSFCFCSNRELGAALPTADTQNSMFGETANHHHVLFHPPLMNHPTHDQHSQMRLGSSDIFFIFVPPILLQDCRLFLFM